MLNMIICVCLLSLLPILALCLVAITFQGETFRVSSHGRKTDCALELYYKLVTQCIYLQAAEYPAGSYDRLIHVACFAVSGYASTAKRTSKPFNPLLGETYEFVCPEKGFRFISEKVV